MKSCKIVLKFPYFLLFSMIFYLICTSFGSVAAGAEDALAPVKTAGSEEESEEIDEVQEVVQAGEGNIVRSLVLILGIVNLALILFQLLTGLRYIKVRLGIHRKCGIILFCTAIIHGMLAYYF